MAKLCPAVILAAGASQRLGQPKSLVEVGDSTLVGIAYQKLVKAGCSPVLIVTRTEHSVPIMQATLGSTVIVNSAPEEGRTGSIQCGIMSLAGDKGRMPKRVIIAPVDRPGWAIEHIKKLLLAKTSSTLSSNGRRGHPLLLEHDAIQTVLAAPPNMSLRELISFDEVNVNAPLLGLNIDHPKDLELLKIHATSLL
ncbi:MAG TPA: NTP transferase domain-containing protein [Candidatus Poseidoniaceae archaeon]|nr:NTP transferase domain-containing protein [Candidatus Poseidoniaceae archaeon]